MYDNNIKLLESNALKHKIESLEIITESNQLIAVTCLFKYFDGTEYLLPL